MEDKGGQRPVASESHHPTGTTGEWRVQGFLHELSNETQKKREQMGALGQGTVQAENLGEKETAAMSDRRQAPTSRLNLDILSLNTAQGLAHGRNQVPAGGNMDLKSDLTSSSLCDLLASVLGRYLVCYWELLGLWAEHYRKEPFEK